MDGLPCLQPINERKLSRILRHTIGNSVEVKRFSLDYVTKPGQNFGGVIRRLTITLSNGEILDIIAKFVPATPFLQNVFVSHITFRKEVDVYTLVIPEFSKLLKEKNFEDLEAFNIYPEYYGSLLNSQNDENLVADENAILLLENLQVRKYKLSDCFIGLDLSHAEVAVSDLAKFHALGVVLKILKPETFKRTVLKACIDTNIGADKTVEGEISMIKEKLTKYEELAAVKNIMPKVISVCVQYPYSKKNPVCEPLASIVHKDFWTNNMMFKYHPTMENKPIKIKIFDFQCCEYSSPLRDFIFFAYTSISNDVLKNHFNRLFILYHTAFINVLKIFDICLDNFQFNDFWADVNRIAPFELFHIIFMLEVIYAENYEKVDQSEVKDFNSLPNANNKQCIDKFMYIVTDYEARGWL